VDPTGGNPFLACSREIDAIDVATRTVTAGDLECVPLLVEVKAPRAARPLRAAALTSTARRDGRAFVAG
jgi:hypothetical protein